MSQTLAPISDITVTNFTGTPVNTAGNRYQNIDEAVADNADFIYSTNNTVGVYECKLTSMTDPINRTGHTLTYRIANTNAGALSGTAFSKITAEIYCGATLIKADTQKTTTASFVAFTLTLTNLEANAITDYTNLRVRFTTTATANRGAAVSYVSFVIPNYTAATEENLITDTEAFTTGWFMAANVSVTQDVANSPSLAGAFNADKFIELDTVSAVHTLRWTRQLASNETLCYSIYVKSVERTEVSVGFDNNLAETSRATFNLSTGLITGIPADATDYTNYAAFMTDAGGGWWKIGATSSKAAVNTNNYPILRTSLAGTTTFAGTNGSGVYVWGANLNHGTIPSAYIRKPTPSTKKFSAMGAG